MRTRLELGTSGSIELTDDIAYSLNFAIADIREPDKRNASFSKTIKIPGSKQNNKLFAHIFEIDIDCNFNPNIKTPCIFYIDEIQQLKGYLQLLKVYYNDELKLEYDVTIKGSIGNIFTAIGDQELNALDFSEYDHTYNQTNIVASWSATVGEGYVYPMLDYGLNNMIDYKVEHFFPAVYVKTYIDKIFALAGYTYSSDFFNTNFFKRLIIPYNGGALGLTEAQINTRLFEAKRSADITLSDATGTLKQAIPYNLDVSDASNQYDAVTTFHFIAGQTGTYTFETINTYSIEYLSYDGFAISITTNIKKISGGVTTVVAVDILSMPPNSTANTTSYLYTSPLFLSVGDVIYIEVVRPYEYTLDSFGNLDRTAGWHSSYNQYMKLTVRAESNFYNAVVNTAIAEGNSLSLNGAIPQKIKIKDFLKGIINMFNLYLDTDKNNELQMNIEPRNDFYNNGTTLDWSAKLDVSKEFVQEPMGALDAKKFIFTYTEDKDYYNGIYKENYNEIYGQQRYEIENDFLTTTKETKIIFSPTPLYDGSQTDRIVSSIIPKELTNTLPKGNNIRILYYGGIISSNYFWNLVTGSGTTAYNNYPYAGHLDNPFNPTIDINYGVPKEIYYSTTLYTNNNLFNVYHKQFVEEITDKDSKILTGYFYLTPKDIYLLDFRNQFFVDGHLLRLNKIYDYNPLANEVTKCEFIKIKKANLFGALTQTSNGGTDVVFPGVGRG